MCTPRLVATPNRQIRHFIAIATASSQNRSTAPDPTPHAPTSTPHAPTPMCAGRGRRGHLCAHQGQAARRAGGPGQARGGRSQGGGSGEQGGGQRRGGGGRGRRGGRGARVPGAARRGRQRHQGEQARACGEVGWGGVERRACEGGMPWCHGASWCDDLVWGVGARSGRCPSPPPLPPQTHALQSRPTLPHTSHTHSFRPWRRRSTRSVPSTLRCRRCC